MTNLEDRHTATQQIARHFDYQHLDSDLQPISRRCNQVAHYIIQDLPDGPELTAGLRKLLEAKDCFVRAAVAAREVDE